MAATVDASRSEPEPPDARRSSPSSWAQAVRGWRASERLAGLAAATCALSPFLPWYRAPIDGLVKTGLGAFGFAEAALLITAGAALVLLLEVGRGRRPPLPLHEGTLLATAGGWCAVIVVFLMFDRPQFQLGGFDQDYSLAYGVFVALGAAALLTLAGIRIRRSERTHDLD